MRQVQSVGCGQDDGVGAVLGQHVLQAGVQGHASGLCMGQGLGGGIDHAGQSGAWVTLGCLGCSSGTVIDYEFCVQHQSGWF